MAGAWCSIWGLGRGAVKFKNIKFKFNQIKFKFKVDLTMAGRTKHATYQERYRHKISEINKTNAEFMAYAEKKEPSFVAGFFAEKTVILTFFFLTTFLAT